MTGIAQNYVKSRSDIFVGLTKKLLKKIKKIKIINIREPKEYRTAIFYAAQYRDIASMRLLYDNEAKIDLKIRGNNNILHESIIGKGFPESEFYKIIDIIKLGLEKKPNLLNEKGINGMTPLILSIKFSRTEVFKFLLDQENTNLNIFDYNNKKAERYIFVLDSSSQYLLIFT